MSKRQRCNHKINTNDKLRNCKRFASINGKCTQHYMKHIFDIEKQEFDTEKQEFGICCFCGNYCNPCSQSCGKCSRML